MVCYMLVFQEVEVQKAKSFYYTKMKQLRISTQKVCNLFLYYKDFPIFLEVIITTTHEINKNL